MATGQTDGGMAKNEVLRAPQAGLLFYTATAALLFGWMGQPAGRECSRPMNEPIIAQFLRREGPTAGTGGLPVVEPYVDGVHRPLVGHGHSIVSIAILGPGAPVTAHNPKTGATIVGTTTGELNETRGMYLVMPEGATAPIAVDAWDVRPA